MSQRDRELAAKLAAQGKKSATETSQAKAAARAERQNGDGPSVEDQLTSFDINDPRPIPRSEASRQNARGHQRSARPSWSK